MGKNGAPPRFERGASCNFEKVPKAGIIPLDHEAWLLLMEKNSRLKSYVGATYLPRLRPVFVCWRKHYELMKVLHLLLSVHLLAGLLSFLFRFY